MAERLLAHAVVERLRRRAVRPLERGHVRAVLQFRRAHVGAVLRQPLALERAVYAGQQVLPPGRQAGQQTGAADAGGRRLALRPLVLLTRRLDVARVAQHVAHAERRVGLDRARRERRQRGGEVVGRGRALLVRRRHGLGRRGSLRRRRRWGSCGRTRRPSAAASASSTLRRGRREPADPGDVAGVLRRPAGDVPLRVGLGDHALGGAVTLPLRHGLDGATERLGRLAARAHVDALAGVLAAHPVHAGDVPLGAVRLRAARGRRSAAGARRVRFPPAFESFGHQAVPPARGTTAPPATVRTPVVPVPSVVRRPPPSHDGIAGRPSRVGSPCACGPSTWLSSAP